MMSVGGRDLGGLHLLDVLISGFQLRRETSMHMYSTWKVLRS